MFSLLLLTLLGNAQILTDSNLPIIVIETDGGVTIPDEPKVLATMKILWHPDGSRNYLSDINNPDALNYNGRIGIERRGSTSQSPAKKPYGLTTLQSDDITHNNVSLLGMPAENDWILNNLSYDQTCMRDFLSYELSERLGQYSTRRRYCEVMVNGDYKGLYVFMEKIKVDKNRVNVQKMDQTCNSVPEVTGGYITKADKTTGGDPVAWTMTGSSPWGWVDYIHHYPKPDEITQAQHNYIKSVFFDLDAAAHAYNENLETGYPAIIDIPSFIDFMMIAEFSSNVDVYSLSTFFHKDRNGKLRAGPVWDYNLAYGHDEFGNRSRYDVWQFSNGNNDGSRFWTDLFNAPTFRCYFARRWFELTQPGQPLSYDFVSNRMDEIDELITEAIGRDLQRWHNLYNHASSIVDTKQWLQQRINWLNNHIGDCSACLNVETPPLVISKIHYHPEDFYEFDSDQLEFIEITNHGDEPVDLSGIYFRELGVTYAFPFGAIMEPHEAIWLCSDSLAFTAFYNATPFGQFSRNLSNKSENLVLVDAWGNVIDEVCYEDDDPWPWLADGEGPYLELIDLDLDNSLSESWTVGYDLTSVSEFRIPNSEFHISPNPTTSGILFVQTVHDPSHVQTVHAPSLQAPTISYYRITSPLGQSLLTGPVTGETFTIDVSHLSNGLYFITIGDFTNKLIISNIK